MVMATQTMLVRLKPYNPKRVHLLRRFTYRGVRFMEDRGWYRVDEEIAGYLRDVRQVDSDPDSPLAFDVCTEEEARAIEEKERKEKRRRARVQEAITVNEATAEPSSPGGTGADDDIDDEKLDAGAGEEPSPDLTTADLPQNKAPAKGTPKGAASPGSAAAKKAGKSSRRK